MATTLTPTAVLWCLSCDFGTSPDLELLLPSTTAQAHTDLSREGRTVQHWQLPFLGLHEFPADLTEFEIQYFFTFTPHEGEAHAPLLTALSTLRGLYARRARQLPDDINASVAPRGAELIGGVDRQRALRAFEAATLFALRKALRNGAVWVRIAWPIVGARRC